MSSKRIFTGNNVYLPGSDNVIPATVTVDKSTGKIVLVEPNVRRKRQDFTDVTADEDFIDAGDKVIIPGLVDAHVHLNEPGRTDWEGFWTGTRAAASGGITTVIDMPLNSIPPTTTVANLEEKRQAAKGQCWTDVGFWGGVIPGNQVHLRPLIDAGVKGFKCFLIESGVEEFPCVAEQDLVPAMETLKGTPTVLCFHAELDTSPAAPEATTSANPTHYQTFLTSRPPELEVAAIKLITSLHARYPSLRLHIVHLSASSALPLIEAAKSSGLPLTIETCFHYLSLSASQIPHGHPEFKCCPPIRSSTNQDALWEGLENGLIDFVVSDHSPCVVELKKVEDGDIMNAWGGISTLGLGLSLLWTEGKNRDVKNLLKKAVQWLAVGTAKHAGLENVKGKLEVGFDGDVVIWDPEVEFTVTKESLNFKNKLTPYEGLTLKGKVQQTYLRGNLVYDAVEGFAGKPVGNFV
ncbi:allantoinase [Abortiporus biennis]|nr:allantoinase [Abortiporus biennis]